MPQIYSKITGTGSALPERATTNQALADELALRNIETSDEWIRTRTGIEKRYLAERPSALRALLCGTPALILQRLILSWWLRPLPI